MTGSPVDVDWALWKICIFTFTDLRLYRAKGSQKEETKEWQCVAHTLAEWEALINVLQQSTDEQDQELYLYLNNELFPPIKTGLQVCPYSSREDADLWRFWIEASNCRWRERVREHVRRSMYASVYAVLHHTYQGLKACRHQRQSVGNQSLVWALV